MKRMSYFVFALVMLVLAVFTSCDDASSSSSEDSSGMYAQKNASVSFIVQYDDTSKTISPKPALMSVSRFSVQGTGPSGTTFGPVFSTGSSIEVKDLLPGEWSILAKAYNSNGNELARGEVKCTLQSGLNRANVSLDTISGEGSVQITLNWKNSFSVDSKFTVKAMFESTSGSKYLETVTAITEDCKVALKKNLPAGSYIMTVKVSDSTGIISGFAEAIRIVANETSIGVVTLEGMPAELEVVISNSIGTPLPVYVQCSPQGNGNYVLRACCDTLPAGVFSSSLLYRWFCNGSAVGFEKELRTSSSNASSGGRYDVIVSCAVLGTTGSASVTI